MPEPYTITHSAPFSSTICFLTITHERGKSIMFSHPNSWQCMFCANCNLPGLHVKQGWVRNRKGGSLRVHGTGQGQVHYVPDPPKDCGGGLWLLCPNWILDSIFNSLNILYEHSQLHKWDKRIKLPNATYIRKFYFKKLSSLSMK